MQWLAPRRWEVWFSRLLLILGVTLMLAGVLYFLAFNWDRWGKLAKLALLQMTVLSALGLALYSKFENLKGKLALLAASVLIGGLLAVFGQIYQTGADSYTLFLTWFIAIAGWVFISHFAPLWALWMIVLHVFLALYWEYSWQYHPSSLFHTSEHQISALMILFACTDLIFLAMREYWLIQKDAAWLASRWTRTVTAFGVIVFALIPILISIAETPQTSRLWPEALAGLLIHLILFLTYRYRIQDAGILSWLVFSVAIMVETLCIRIAYHLSPSVHGAADIFLFPLLAVMTLAIFAFSTTVSRRIARSMEANHVAG